MALLALGVVYGDIGTSPLYALRECLAHGRFEPGNPLTVYGPVSLMFWSLTIIVTIKYLIVLTLATNQGEGGVFNLGYQITAWGDTWYQSDPGNPATYVFVRDGVREVSALPSRGGSRFVGQQWIANRPGWPPKPSLLDVVYHPPASQPSKEGS